MYVSAIVVAAGKGLRFKSSVPKPLVLINGKPVIIYSLQVLQKHPLIKEIVVVVNAKNKAAVTRQIKRYRLNKAGRVVYGGERRQDSVYRGLLASQAAADLVLIHDAARPFLDKAMVTAAIKEAALSGSAICGVPAKATIKSAVSCQLSAVSKVVVEKTLNREKLWEIQTPQVFKKDLLLAAFKRFAQIDATDEAMLVEKSGAKVSVVPGSYNNIKITTPEDLVLAQMLGKIRAL